MSLQPFGQKLGPFLGRGGRETKRDILSGVSFFVGAAFITDDFLYL